MQATGSYWKPVYNFLEGSFTTWVVNPAHIKNVPGRKTDVSDTTWIADLLRHGLLRPSFIPDRPQRELRQLTRQRTQWSAARSRDVNRIQKVLEGANVKLASTALEGRMGAHQRFLLAAPHACRPMRYTHCRTGRRDCAPGGPVRGHHPAAVHDSRDESGHSGSDRRRTRNRPRALSGCRSPGSRGGDPYQKHLSSRLI